MAIEHLRSDTSGTRIAEVLQRDGVCVVDALVEREYLARFRTELAPFLDATPLGGDSFAGRRTKRTGALLARSPLAREMVQHPLVLDAARGVLDGGTGFQIHLTQVISIGPGEPMQMIHRDQWAFDFFPFPRGYEAQCNTIWALDDFRAENGATRVIPGSNRFEDGLRFEEKDTEPAEMSAGSVLFYTGSLYHGGGANRSDAVRSGVNLTYNRTWLRQEENQYLSVPLEVARTFDEKLLRLMGYARGAYALGYIDDVRDPLEAVRPGDGRSGFGAAPRAAAS